MKTHLDERDVTTAVAGLELGPAAEEHLASCLSCRQKIAAMRDLIDARRRQMMDTPPDWDRQRREILLQLPVAPNARPVKTRRWMRPVLAAAAVLVIAVGLEVLWVPATPGDPTAGLEIPIEQILADVDAVLADEILPGFESIDPGVDDLESYFENGAS